MTAVIDEIYNADLSERSPSELMGAEKRLQLDLEAEELKFKEIAEPIKAAITKVRGALRTWMLAEGVNKVTTVYGTAYFSKTTRHKVVDRELFFSWVFDNRAFDVLTTHVSDKAIEERGVTPPGIEATPYTDLRIRSD